MILMAADRLVTFAMVDDAGGRFAIDQALAGEITVVDGLALDFEQSANAFNHGRGYGRT